MGINNRKYNKKKSLFSRIIIAVFAVIFILGIVMIPIRSSAADDTGENITVENFESGKLSDAISEAANGTDYNFIKNVAVLSGTLTAEDFTALTAIPNLEILELAGTEVENGVIPENALMSRNQLSFISLPKNTSEIGSNAFSGNRKLVKISMPSSVKKIGDFAFDACESLESFPISESVEYIGEGAFRDCKSITEFAIPSGITEIYPDTFSKCGFESISIGPDITSIGSGVFADCSNLKNIYAYAKEAPALDGDVFRNVSAAVHCYADSEESYQSWLMQNMTVSGDLTGEYVVSGEEAPEETPAAAASAAESEESVGTTEAAPVPSESVTSAAAQTEAAAPAQSGGISVGVTVVIVIMAMIIAVLATILVMNSKKNKQ